jgi:hypothetical protein
MSSHLTVECEVHFDRKARGRKRLAEGAGPDRPEPGRVPRVARLMALALRFEALLRDGAVRDYAELARLGRVTRARGTQIMNLLYLAPDLQEEVLFLPRTERGRDRVQLRHLLPVAGILAWRKQRRVWDDLRLSR